MTTAGGRAMLEVTWGTTTEMVYRVHWSSSCLGSLGASDVVERFTEVADLFPVITRVDLT